MSISHIALIVNGVHNRVFCVFNPIPVMLCSTQFRHFLGCPIPTVFFPRLLVSFQFHPQQLISPSPHFTHFFSPLAGSKYLIIFPFFHFNYVVRLLHYDLWTICRSEIYLHRKKLRKSAEVVTLLKGNVWALWNDICRWPQVIRPVSVCSQKKYDQSWERLVSIRLSLTPQKLWRQESIKRRIYFCRKKLFVDSLCL